VTDMSPAHDESDEKPLNVAPCWEEHDSKAVSPYDPEAELMDVPELLRDIRARLARLETGTNQIGQQTNWLVQEFHAAQTAFVAMSQQLAQHGPLGLIKMMTGRGKKESKGIDHG
jgi:hypothetical protein